MKCRVCGKVYPKSPINFCVDDFGPLEVAYDYERVKANLTRAKI
jgi:threonine synthase